MSNDTTKVLKRTLFISLGLFTLALCAVIALFMFIQVVFQEDEAPLDNMPKKEQN